MLAKPGPDILDGAMPKRLRPSYPSRNSAFVDLERIVDHLWTHGFHP